MKRVVLTLSVFVAFAVLIGCGTSSKAPASKLSISPTSASVKTGAVQQFAATMTDNPYPGVNWTVESLTGGSLTVGTIDTSGRYIAPATVPNPAKVTVTATLISDATQTASATVTITAGDPVAITISPTTASVPATQTQQFTATISNTANLNVIWSVNDVVGGDSAHGTIDAYGVYSAPAIPPADNADHTVTIKATAQADSTKTATATVTVTPFTYLAVTPSAVPAIHAGAQQQFTAKLNGQTLLACPSDNAVCVTWRLSCNSTAAGACGSIDGNGLYTAPLSPPPGQDVNVTAVGTSPDPNTHIHDGGATVTVQFANPSLTGKYALSFSGKNSAAEYTAAGSIIFDGNSNITGGELDINDGTVSHVAVTGGTYNIGTQGRGVATINTANGTLSWSLVLASHSQAHVISSTATGPIGSGTLDLQDAAAFTPESIKGAYAISAAGPNAHNGATFAMGGAFSADGAGHLSGGTLDINNAGDVQSRLALTAGDYTAPSSNGRGTLSVTSSFGTQNFVYYVVDADHLKLLSTAAARVASGNLTKQPAGPFAAGTFNSGYAFVLAGSKAGQPRGLGGIFRLDGAGTLTAGTMDINNNGNVASALAMAGTYTVPDTDTGRTTLAVTVNGASMHYVIYPQVDGLNLVGTDATEVTSGLALAQNETNFTASTIAGIYALSLAGTDLVDNPGEEVVLGQIGPNGSTTLSGVLYINDNGAVGATVPLQSATYQAAASGRFGATLPTAFASFTSATFNVYLVDRDGTRALWLETDPNRVLTGIMQKQY